MIDARRFLAGGPNEKVYVCSIEGGEPVPVAGIAPVDGIVGPSTKEGTIWLRRGRDLPARIVRLDLASGRGEPFREFAPADPTGIIDLIGIHVARDGRHYGYSYGRVLSDLYLVEGLK